ncbi:hypothetical protein ABZ322_01800 [Streptomyces sp. NPDC006129]|uniref:hypothetical protein n=1 Tax=Streptomyces sp. NPDC006129 TaxID=3155348 RepID=UPI0033A7A949
MSDLEGEVPLVTGSAEVRARVCAQARGLDAGSVGSRRRAVEDHLRFARGSGAAGESERVRLEAELPEWQRIEALLESSGQAGYDPESDRVAAAAAEEMRRRERAAADAREAARGAERERREGALRRAEDLLAQDRNLDASVLVEADDPHVRSMLCGRSPAAVRQIDARMARALTARLGALADPGVRAAAWEALPQRVTAHAALLKALAGNTAGFLPEALPFAGALAAAAPEATEQLARWLAATPGPA